RGDVDYRIEVHPKDEMRVLADSFNNMADEVKKIMGHISERERMQRELEVARIIQMTILPDRVPPYPNLAIATHWQPAEELGGDYYDLIPISERALGIAIGDVSGHGVAAGILASMAKSCLFTQLSRSPGVDEVMFAMNTMVFEVFKKKLLMTFLYAVIDCEKSEFAFANAGHLSPYHFRMASKEVSEIENPAYPLGVRKDSEYSAQNIALERGDALLLYSDGVVEAANSDWEQFGFERLESLLQKHGTCSAAELKQHILTALDIFCDGQPRTDDATLIVIKVK
ncbi:MAG: SpoIIE family protein phosphatase, partial [Candidatus Hydrogenedentota bacterium]